MYRLQVISGLVDDAFNLLYRSGHTTVRDRDMVMTDTNI